MSYQEARINMVKQQLRTSDVLDESILSLYDLIPREAFVPEEFAPFAYSDLQIPLGRGQRMLSPLEEGKILQELGLQGKEIVLEIGTGSGFFTALLSQLSHQVISIDCETEFTEKARSKLAAHQCNNVELITGDAYQGWLEHAPYEVIVFTGAIEKLNETHKLQIVPGGKLFAIEGEKPPMEGRLYQLGHNEDWQESLIFTTNIPLLINKLKTKEFVF